MRGEFAGACAHYDEAATVVAEVGAVEDVIRMRSQQALLYWLDGDRNASAAAIAEAGRQAEGVTWPHALVEVALARAELARWAGHAEEARRQLGLATVLLGEDAEQDYFRAEIHGALGYLADDLAEARAHCAAAWEAASEAGQPSVIAQMLVGVADLAARLGEYEQAARLLAASVGVRGLPDRSRPDAARIEQDARRSPRRRTVRRGDGRGYADELGRAGRGHAPPAHGLVSVAGGSNRPQRSRVLNRTPTRDGPPQTGN